MADEIVYPPLDVPKPFAPGVHVVDSGPHRAFGIPLPVRMTVIRLSDGGLLLHAPTRYTDTLADALCAFGPIRHLVMPNPGHFAYVGEWQRAFPEAVTWAAPGMKTMLRWRGGGVTADAELGDAPPEAWADDVDQAIVPGAAGFREVLFVHKASRTLVLTDLIVGLERERLPGWLRVAAGAVGASRAVPAAPAYLKAVVLARRRSARRAVARMLAHEPRRAIFAHGKPFADDASQRLRASFRWLLE